MSSLNPLLDRNGTFAATGAHQGHEVAFIAAVTEMMFGDDAQPFEVAVLHHTGCGSGFLADPAFRAAFVERTNADDAAVAASAVTDPIASVTHDVALLRDSSMVPARATVSGHVYDVDTGVITPVLVD